MKKEELGKYVVGLSPELQEKARECKTMEELNVLLAENDVELSEDALQAVAGGCGTTKGYKCMKCGANPLEYVESKPFYENWPMAMFFRCPKCKQMHYTGHTPWDYANMVYGPFLCK